MFAVRGVVVCLALFGVMYGTLSSLVAAAWWAGRRLLQRPLSSNPSILFGIRILAFAVSALFAVFLTLPSFWLMERRALDEDVTTFFLALGALVLLSSGIARASKASRVTSRLVSRWLRKPDAGGEVGATMTSADEGAPALMLAGIWRPKVMVSDTANAVLSENELRLAIRHELGHRRSWDNLKKLLMNAIPFPGMSGIERAWREAAELAADDSAVENRQDALDLATALIKLSRSASRWTEPQIASAFVCGSSAVAMRVQRLLDWRRGAPLQNLWPWFFLVLLIVAAIASNYGTALVMTHRLTEVLVP
jgi:Zn-dependent protease with chaperone function